MWHLLPCPVAKVVFGCRLDSVVSECFSNPVLGFCEGVTALPVITRVLPGEGAGPSPAGSYGCVLLRTVQIYVEWKGR